MVKIVENADGTIAVQWHGATNRSSLYHTLAKGNAEDANRLDAPELFAVAVAAHFNPFPMGRGEKFYAEVLAGVETGEYKMTADQKEGSIGEWRSTIVEACGSSCNGPTDSYLRIAVRHKEKAKAA